MSNFQFLSPTTTVDGYLVSQTDLQRAPKPTSGFSHLLCEGACHHQLTTLSQRELFRLWSSTVPFVRDCWRRHASTKNNFQQVISHEVRFHTYIPQFVASLVKNHSGGETHPNCYQYWSHISASLATTLCWSRHHEHVVLEESQIRLQMDPISCQEVSVVDLLKPLFDWMWC